MVLKCIDINWDVKRSTFPEAGDMVTLLAQRNIARLGSVGGEDVHVTACNGGLLAFCPDWREPDMHRIANHLGMLGFAVRVQNLTRFPPSEVFTNGIETWTLQVWPLDSEFLSEMA